VKITGVFPGRGAAFLLAFGMALMTVSLASGAPTASLVDPTARLNYGATSGSTELVLQVDGLSSQDKQSPTLLQNIRDLGQPSLPNVDVRTQEREPAGATARTWLVMLTVKDLPANSSQKRHLSLDVAGRTTLVEYTLTNQAVASFSWTVKAPASIAIQPGQAIPIGVFVGPVPATAVTVVNPYLVETKRKSLIAQNGLQLCRAPTGTCDRIDIPANTAVQLWMQGADGIGQYDGSLTVAANEKPQGDVITLTVYSTTLCLQAFGILAIFLGVLLAWGVIVFGRNLLNRDQMLVPAALLRARLSALRPDLEQNPTGVATPRISANIDALLNNLTPAQLATVGLPGILPTPGSTVPSADQLTAYRQRLQQSADWASVLETIVNDGLKLVWSRWANANNAQRQIITTAITNLDTIAEGQNPPSLDTVRPLIQAELNRVNAAFPAAPAALGGAPPSPKTYEQLNVQILQISAITWIVVIVATTAVGALALVLNSSFGSLSDFVTCVLWGLGLPIGGQALSASLGSVGTSFGVSVTR
jgi:hypothetical protein